MNIRKENDDEKEIVEKDESVEVIEVEKESIPSPSTKENTKEPESVSEIDDSDPLCPPTNPKQW